MTAIGLMMMGVFNQEQLNLLHFLPQKISTLQHDLQLTNHQLNKLAVYSQISPPEFMQISETSPNYISVLSLRRNKIFEKVVQKQMSTNSFELADAGNIYKKGIQVSTRYSATRNKTMPVIGFGNSGISVKVLQKLLVSNGYGVPIDGVFGPITETAVKAFQNRRSLSTDGVVGQKTWWELTM
jgi:Putative peptidoglycan binding domain